MPHSARGPVRELPEYLRQWDGRPSNFYPDGQPLAYLTPAPLPTEFGGTPPRWQLASSRVLSPRRRTVNVPAVQRLLRPAEGIAGAPIVTADRAFAILNLPVHGMKNARALEALQEETYRLLRTSHEARVRRERIEQEGGRNTQEETDDPHEAQLVATTGDANGEKRIEERPPAEDDEADAGGNEPRRLEPAPPRHGRTGRPQPPLLAPRSRRRPPTESGRVEFCPGIDQSVRHNMGPSKLPKYRVMSLPWNLSMLSEEEQARQKDRAARRDAKERRQAVADLEAQRRATITKDERAHFNVIRSLNTDESARLRKRGTKRSTPRKVAPRSDANDAATGEAETDVRPPSQNPEQMPAQKSPPSAPHRDAEPMEDEEPEDAEKDASQSNKEGEEHQSNTHISNDNAEGDNAVEERPQDDSSAADRSKDGYEDESYEEDDGVP